MGTGTDAVKVLKNHQFKVTFAAGYDDLGRSPTFHTMLNTEGPYATAVPSTARARLYDQRFSNSIWLGKLTGYAECTQAANTETCDLQHTELDGNVISVVANAENGDVWVTSEDHFQKAVKTTYPTVSDVFKGSGTTNHAKQARTKTSQSQMKQFASQFLNDVDSN